MHRRLRRAEWVALVVVLAVILTIVLWPTPVDRPYDSGLSSTLSDLHRRGVPQWVDYLFVETTANVIMFAPLGALIASVAMPRLWWASGVLGLALSLSVEFTQAEFLAQRMASAGDVVANTSGAILGGLIVAVSRHAVGRRRVRAQDRRTPAACIRRSPRTPSSAHGCRRGPDRSRRRRRDRSRRRRGPS